MANCLAQFCRRKPVYVNQSDTQLKRVLSTIDLTLLGIGSTLGIGIYVLAGSVAKDDAGPAVVISFLVAALASVLAGLCYAEFGARVPKAGSAYVYSYVCVGELIAFIVGWNLIMEYVIGVASVAKGYSGYVDSLCNGTMKQAFTSITPINVSFLSSYVDFFAFAITLTVTCVLAFGVKESSLFNNVFTALNLCVVVFVVIAGSFYAKASNWTLSVEEINETLSNVTGKAGRLGTGGFAPFGFSGIMKGAATCFYGFVGFDCIATTGEEAKNPQKAIPLSIIFSLLFIFLAYFGISTVLTMMVPYYLQDSHAPLPEAFMYVDFTAGKWVVTVGAIFGLSTSLLGAMFPMPRVIYAMASDGVLFKFLAKVNRRTQTPFIATIIAGTFGGIMAALFDLDSLIDMMSIGTLTAYTLVAICVLVLRYRKDEDGADDIQVPTNGIESVKGSWKDYVGLFYNKGMTRVPTETSTTFSGLLVIAFCFLTILFCGVAIFAEHRIINGDPVFIIILSLLGFLVTISVLSLSLQPVSRVKLTFKVPLVPFLPAVSVLANVYLIMKLSGPTWIRFGCWMAVGFLIYGYCLLSGTTGRAYKQQIEDANASKRKYSKISVHGIDNPTLELNNGEKGKVILNGRGGGQMQPSAVGSSISNLLPPTEVKPQQQTVSVVAVTLTLPAGNNSINPPSYDELNGNAIEKTAVTPGNKQQTTNTEIETNLSPIIMEKLNENDNEESKVQFRKANNSNLVTSTPKPNQLSAEAKIEESEPAALNMNLPAGASTPSSTSTYNTRL